MTEAADLIQAVFVDRMGELLEQQRTLAKQRLRVTRTLNLLEAQSGRTRQGPIAAALVKPFDEWQQLLDKWLEEVVVERNKQFARLEKELAKALEKLRCPAPDDQFDGHRDWNPSC